MGRPKEIFTCHKLGCYNQYYEDLNNIVQHGRPMSDPAWKTHQLELLTLRRPQPLVEQMFLAENSGNVRTLSLIHFNYSSLLKSNFPQSFGAANTENPWMLSN
ncbi:hypothetical protein O181_052027 [Austropuccinia psidii MF-1]|uniref:Uncharacterized protein n=1 Tax=Austropuccinia psidii MF-1 TaxID=1389203 RepID=A0A9Q3E6T7_9BASI|nr:hypothetical protein [Austropuccinia psidii MF-1]